MSVRIPDFQRVRAQLDNFVKHGPMNDLVSNGPAVFARGSNLRFEFALFYGEEIADPSAITTARLRVLADSSPDSAIALDKTIGITSMNLGITLAQWNAGGLNDCHLAFEFTAAECAGSVFGTPDDEQVHWFQLTYGPDDTTWAFGTLTSFDPGYDAAGNAPPADPTNISREEVVALLNSFGAQFVKYVGNPAGIPIELTSANGKKATIGADDNGDIATGTSPTT